MPSAIAPTTTAMSVHPPTIRTSVDGGVSDGHLHDALEQDLAVETADGQEVEQAPAECGEEDVVDERLGGRRSRQEPCREHDHDAEQQASQRAGECEDDAAMDAGVVAGRLAATAMEDDAGCDPKCAKRGDVAGLVREDGGGRHEQPHEQERVGVSLEPEHRGQDEERRPDLDRHPKSAEPDGWHAVDSLSRCHTGSRTPTAVPSHRWSRSTIARTAGRPQALPGSRLTRALHRAIYRATIYRVT